VWDLGPLGPVLNHVCFSCPICGVPGLFVLVHWMAYMVHFNTEMQCILTLLKCSPGMVCMLFVVAHWDGWSLNDTG